MFLEARDEYVGVAVALVNQLRSVDADVIDDPAPFVGHANILHAFPAADMSVPMPQEPEEAEALEASDQYYKAVAGLFTFLEDPTPGLDGWTGTPMARAT